MKKVLTICSVFLGTVFLIGCSQQPLSQTQPVATEPAPITPGNILWKSEALGDFVRDDRDPNSVCKIIQSEQGLNNCSIIISRKSQDKSECADGMSVAGCFACKFECPLTQTPITNQPTPTISNNRTGVQCIKDTDCDYLKKQEPCFKNGGSLTLTPYCIDGYCECRCGRDNDEMCD